MALIFKPVDLQNDLEIFSNLRTQANIEILGYSTSTEEKFKNYIAKNLSLLGKHLAMRATLLEELRC